MLTHIDIRDLAVVERLSLDLEAGMTALTGETGAGKSIFVDALGLALGDRADTEAIRPGADTAEINLVIDTDTNALARHWLVEQGLEGEEAECFLRRVIHREGRSRGFINGRPVPMQSLRDLGERLLDIHGQHAHQSLLRRDVQRALLDDFAGIADQVAALEELHGRWRASAEALARLRAAEAEREHRLELLRYQVRELEALGLGAEDIAALDTEQRQLAHAGELLSGGRQALEALYEGEAGTAYGLLTHAAAELRRLAGTDARLDAPVELLDNALIQLQEGVEELRRYLEGVELDPQRLRWVEERLGEIHTLARKHELAPEALPERLEALRRELDELDHAGERLAGLAEETGRLEREYYGGAQALSARRQAAAPELAARVTELMRSLGMPGGELTVAVTAEPERPGPTGLDRVEHLVTANPGMPVRPLAKVASGGELSRISLAIQVATVGGGALPTLVFDEVDAGIGGGVAEIVGHKLRALAEAGHQVLCVTHLAQVAAQAHRHLSVSKATEGAVTRVAIEGLDEGGRVDELARMLGGVEITAQTRAHAREMLERARGDGAPAAARARGGE